jgi:hypothetical protein
MAYSKYTIICNGDIPAEIMNKKCLKLIVLTQDDDFVSKADFLAQEAPMSMERYVVWIKNANIDSIRNQIPNLPERLSKVVAFSLSTINKLALVINEGDIIDIPGIDYAFILASDLRYNQNS